jgi:hypothetical protein
VFWIFHSCLSHATVSNFRRRLPHPRPQYRSPIVEGSLSSLGQRTQASLNFPIDPSNVWEFVNCRQDQALYIQLIVPVLDAGVYNTRTQKVLGRLLQSSLLSHRWW